MYGGRPDPPYQTHPWILMGGLLQIGNDVFNVLDPHRQTKQVIPNTHSLPLAGGYISMRTHRRVEHHRMHIAKAGGSNYQFQTVHEGENFIPAGVMKFDADH